METLTKWSAKRAGASITILHATGRVTGIVRIEPRPVAAPGGGTIVVAVRGDGKEYRLA